MLNAIEHWEPFANIADSQDSVKRGRKSSVRESLGRILLVEDEPISQKYCQILLRNRGYQVDVAGDGKTALDYIAKQCYQSILMDVGLPDICGIDVARAIRTSDNPNRQVPIIALTAHLAPSKQQSCLDAGMTAFLNKPVSPNALCAMLEQVVSSIRK